MFFSIFARSMFAALFASALATGSSAQANNTDTAKSPTGAAQASAATAARDEKAEQIVSRAIEAMGGRAYLDVRSVVSSGNFTPFRDGVAGLPYTFLDYLIFPDRERTEFRGEGARSIETHTGDAGWIFDGKTRKLQDVTPEQAKDFRITLRTDINNILRGWWRADGARLSYVGRREAGLAKRNEVVRVVYPDGFAVDFEFGAKDNLPSKALYKKRNKEGDEVVEEDRYAQFLNVGGAVVPFVIDHFRAGVQSSRVNYEKVQFNQPVPDSLFARPADVKSIK
jgi:hypothetical protein